VGQFQVAGSAQRWVRFKLPLTDLAGAHTVAVGHADHHLVTEPLPTTLGGTLDQPIGFIRRQVKALIGNMRNSFV